MHVLFETFYVLNKLSALQLRFFKVIQELRILDFGILVLLVDLLSTTEPVPQPRYLIVQLLVGLLQGRQLLGHHDVLPGLRNV